MSYNQHRQRIAYSATRLAHQILTAPEKDLPALLNLVEQIRADLTAIASVADNARVLVFGRLQRSDLRPATLSATRAFLTDDDLRAILAWCSQHPHHLRVPRLREICMSELDLRQLLDEQPA